MSDHPLLEQLDKCLSEAIPAHEIQLSGQWSSASRRTYRNRPSCRFASGALVDVVDVHWHGTLASERPLGAMAFLLHQGDLHWAKSPEISSSLTVEISLHAYADFHADRATLASSVGGARLPGVPVTGAGSGTGACVITDAAVRTGRAAFLARATDAELFAALIPGELLKMGRKRVWHIRDSSSFAGLPRLHDLMTKGRTGTIPADYGGMARDGTDEG